MNTLFFFAYFKVYNFYVGLLILVASNRHTIDQPRVQPTLEHQTAVTS